MLPDKSIKRDLMSREEMSNESQFYQYVLLIVYWGLHSWSTNTDFPDDPCVYTGSVSYSYWGPFEKKGLTLCVSKRNCVG